MILFKGLEIKWKNEDSSNDMHNDYLSLRLTNK